MDVRPTTDRTKESMFGVLNVHKEIRGAKVLDLFGGSGNLGFEAISRGASEVLFVELNPAAVKHIQNTAEQFGVDSQITVLNMSVEKFLQGQPQPFDIVFTDPPYDVPFIGEMISGILNDGWLKEKGWFLLEHDKRHTFKEHPHCGFSKAYGRTIVSIFYAEPVTRDET